MYDEQLAKAYRAIDELERECAALRAERDRLLVVRDYDERLQQAVIAAHVRGLPANWEYTDPQTTLDLLIAECKTAQYERDAAIRQRDALAEACRGLMDSDAAECWSDAVDRAIAALALLDATAPAPQPDSLHTHKWTGCQLGGNPSDATSYEWVRYCEVCGMEDTCEDPLPPCTGAAPDGAQEGTKP